MYFTEINKSSSDVAAEGAILNEMLEIVAKRAALRPSDIFQQRKLSTTTSGCDLTVQTTNDSDVSHKTMLYLLLHSFCRQYFNFNLLMIFCQFFILYACILYYAYSQV